MNEKYLVINGGSSSLKFTLYSMPDKKEILKLIELDNIRKTNIDAFLDIINR